MRSPSDPRGGLKSRPPAKLIELHRHSLTTLLVIGGHAVNRRAVALSFHQASPLKEAPFVALDCRSEGVRLKSALQALLAKAAPDPGADPVRAAWGGTLFLDEVEALPRDTQRLLLCFAKRTLGGSVAAEAGWPVRLMTGASESPDAATLWSLLPELHDEIDKIRVDLEQVHAGAA